MYIPDSKLPLVDPLAFHGVSTFLRFCTLLLLLCSFCWPWMLLQQRSCEPYAIKFLSTVRDRWKQHRYKKNSHQKMTGNTVYYGYQNLICIMLYHISCIQITDVLCLESYQKHQQQTPRVSKSTPLVSCL